MKRSGSILAVLLLALALAQTASGSGFGLKELDNTFTNQDGSPQMQAGAHPFAATGTLAVEEEENPALGRIPVGQVRDLRVALPPGLVGSPYATPQCDGVDFATRLVPESGLWLPNCPESSTVGQVTVEGANGEGVLLTLRAPLFNLVPPPGVAAKFGFIVPLVGTPVTIEGGVNPDPPYNLFLTSTNTTQISRFFSAKVTLWGNPSDPSHDSERGICGFFFRQGLVEAHRGGECPTSNPDKPFITLPRSCEGPLPTTWEATSWQGNVFRETIFTHGLGDDPLGITGCSTLGFGPAFDAQPTDQSASSPTGLDFDLDVHDEGLTAPDGLAESDFKAAQVTLPEGMTINPSQAEGLAVCSEAALAREQADSQFGEGCPAASKIGTVEVETPLLEGTLLKGSLFVAEPYKNRFGTLIALYMTVAEPRLGIIFKLAGKVEPDPKTGQLVASFDEIPPYPFSHFHLHFREGGRSPLVTPPLCGTYTTEALFTPTANPARPFPAGSSFQVTHGPGAGPCPTGGTPPFHPGLEAGTINNAAGRYSPFNVRLSRTDSEQEITHFSIKLPPGLIGKLAGIPFCSDAAIAAAKARTGPHGGQEELESPSCPAASQVGRTLVGAGVGPSLTYVPGKVYLAGPYHGSALSIVSITSGVAGPFDLGTVVVREALKVNPETAEVFIDATGSDPIPHIIQGIPVHLRDIRIYTDRPEFVLNPTNCERTSTASTVLGSGLNFASESDDQPVTVTSPFQAADCASLGFAPKLALSLKGKTKRGGTPALKAVLTYPKGSYANVKAAQVTLPHSEFLEQAHIKTICTRVQFKEGTVPGEKCPAASIYGFAKAVTPLLDEPLQGPVYLRSSSHNLPDLVAALNSGKINVDLDGRIDSVKGGRIRNTFEAVPDAPVTKFTLEMQGGKKGLLVNSTNLCKSTNRAIADFTGQNGKVHDFNPVVGAQCPKGRKGKKHKATSSRSRRLALRSPW